MATFVSVSSTVRFHLESLSITSSIFRLWTVNVPAESEDIIINIHGKAIAFQECFVLDTPFIIPRPKHSFPSKENDASLGSPRNSDMSITWSACFPTTAVLLTDFGTFYTSDGFRTYEEIKVPSDVLTQGLNNSVTDVALTDNGILFLINGTIYKRESNHFFKLGAEHKLPEAKITGICSRYWCPLFYPVQIARYDWNKYGCLMELHYEQYFQPIISLYDGDKYVRRVETNFILWEMEGRTDYGYTSSMKEEGCLYKAQSWPMMLNASQNSTLDEIWGPQNSTDEGLYEQYQILNMTSRNSIVWSTSHSGIYVFRVRIIDPNYSFCDLKAFFAVRTYGIIERSDISSVLLYSFLIICIFGVFLILSYFRYTKIFQELKRADEKRASPEEQEN
ncbi:PREDICTED: uncharacterized protein C1orf101 homolog [Tinamus guttatus]|uniref:uncharacterized protein C1orf101 homolog n=1 Tax=Tinamus guttatus TaxID=94827 RepID=UPI00052F29DA|nr:PREDICTED: uncharacterized protein C1orf101 homolog [Tinamus guttatus]